MAAIVAPVADDVRVITTIGHVDHGKTTFVDYLLAANNIISSRLAGKVRYMDSREDEQQRGITMESSAVSLRFKTAAGLDGVASKTYAINLIDTPGHVDFSTEVSVASRLCDGALVLVDVVEGVCTQTVMVLRQAWVDRVRPILVINKMDRLIMELKLTPMEAYHHLTQLIEQVNAVMGSFFAADRMEDDLRWRENREKRLAERRDTQADATDGIMDNEFDFNEQDDEDLYFAPERGNVIFASALDGWGFRTSKFAQLYATKLGIKEANLKRVLWGDFYLDPKAKRVISHKHLRGRSLKPLFVQFILENIWAVYDSVNLNPNPDKVTKIVTALNIKVPPRELKSKDTRHVLSLIFGHWLSLSTCTVQAVIEVIPPPSVAQRMRIPKFLYPDLNSTVIEPKNKLEKDLLSCDDSPEAFVVAFVSKMFSVASSELPENKKRPLTAEDLRRRAQDSKSKEQLQAEEKTAEPPLESENIEESNHIESETILGFARLYSGILRVGTSVYCVLPKFKSVADPSRPHKPKHVSIATVEALYVMMGRDLIPVDSVKAGNVFAIKGLEGKVFRTASLCAPRESYLKIGTDVENDNECFVNLGGVSSQVLPIVRVAIEPVESANMPRLIQGLKFLSQADPCVETFQQQTGEHVILTAGELHLERCLKDLRERFAKVDIQASKPIVPFRETAVKGIDMLPSKTQNMPRGTITGSSAFLAVKFTIRAVPLPNEIFTFIQENLSIVKKLHRDWKTREENIHSEYDFEEDESLERLDEVLSKPTTTPGNFWDAFINVCSGVAGEWSSLAEKVWAFGPQGAGGCVLVDARSDMLPNSLMTRLTTKHNSVAEDHRDRLLQDFETGIEIGFQIATLRGPLCAEPVEGLAYFVQSIEYDKDTIDRESSQNHFAQIRGSLITAVTDTCKAGLLDWSPRLKLAMYSCDIQASTDVLGKVYGVVAKRRGRIVAEEMKEGTSFFTIKALLPVIESFGFADDIRKRTSGAASPQLIFNGYELLDQDPFWVPTTEEELEDLGEKADRSNVAKGYMDSVRERKGLFVDKKIVEFAEKQRTLKR